jgi:hypothetical protein
MNNKLAIREILKNSSDDACRLAISEAGELKCESVFWKEQRAPHSHILAAPDARTIASLLDGWNKISLPSEYEDVEGDGKFTNTLDGIPIFKFYPVPDGSGPPVASQNISLPDEWLPGRNYHHAWYLLKADLGILKSKQLWMKFDTVSHACVLFVNGTMVGRHQGGYTPFEFDITSSVKDGENLFAVWAQDDTVARRPDGGIVSQMDYGSGALNGQMAGMRGGIYLEERESSHISRIRIRTSTRQNSFNVETWIRGGTSELRVSHTVYEWPDGKKVLLEIPEASVPANSAGELKIESNKTWRDAKRWSPAHPNLYVLRTRIICDGHSESLETRFGFREFWIEGRQFILNGVPVRLLGDGGHPFELRDSIDPRRSLDFNRRCLAFFKDNFNFMSLRLHDMVHPAWSSLAADEAGVLIINQSGLRHNHIQGYDKGREDFLSNLEIEFDEWYWRDVNNPSIVIWDVENELIRGARPPAREKWVLGLDEFIWKNEPNAIVEHSGAAYYSPQQQIIHVHMQEQNSRIMREWHEKGIAPIVMGEFWMGGRGETRLPNSYEYSDREDWHREEARLYREHLLEMRYYGVSGVMPHRLTRWPLINHAPLVSKDTVIQDYDGSIFKWRFPTIRNYGARGIAPVVVFAWPRSASVQGGLPFEKEIVVCNDRAEKVSLEISCEYGSQSKSWHVELAPAEQKSTKVNFTPDPSAQRLAVSAKDKSGHIIEEDDIPIHVLPAEKLSAPKLQRRVVVVPTIDGATANALDELGIRYAVSETFPEDADQTIVLLPSRSADDALGGNAARLRAYLEADGRLLAMPQEKLPRWLPLGLQFWSALRSSVPEFDRGGWDATNKDMIYSREIPVHAAKHPILDSMTQEDFKEWSPLDGRISDDAFVRPNTLDVAAKGPYRVILGATRRENASLVEFSIGSGTGILCQAQVIEQRANPAARAMLFNMLKYLDGPAWNAGDMNIGLLGEISPGRLAELTGIDERFFLTLPTSGTVPGLILAGDHADVDLITDYAQKGSTVIVLSCETTGRLAGYRVEQDSEAYYSATRINVEDHHLFWGISGASFVPLRKTPAKGALSSTPADAKILLNGHAGGHSPFGNSWVVDYGFYGLETRESAPPLAACQTLGNGTLVASTIEPWDVKSETHRQLICHLLANAGVSIPNTHGQITSVKVKSTAPLKFDGCLDDWMNDMEDLSISEYSHADPIVLSSRDIASGSVESDLDMSGIFYMLHDERYLFLGGIIFSADEAVKAIFEMDGKSLAVDLSSRSVTLEGEPVHEVKVAFGNQKAGEIIDTKLLGLMSFHKQTGKTEFLSDTKGRTFEIGIPWNSVGHSKPPVQIRGKVRIDRNNKDMLQVPPPADTGEERFLLFQPVFK